MILNTDKRIIRDNNEVKQIDLKNNKEEEIYYTGENPELAKIIYTNKDDKVLMYSYVGKKMEVNNKTLQELQEKIWYVIKSSSNFFNDSAQTQYDKRFISKYQYCLRKNDIIKLGRIKYLVKDLGLVNGYSETAQETFIPHYEIE